MSTLTFQLGLSAVKQRLRSISGAAEVFMLEFKRNKCSYAPEFISLWVERCSNSCYEDPQSSMENTLLDVL